MKLKAVVPGLLLASFLSFSAIAQDTDLRQSLQNHPEVYIRLDWLSGDMALKLCRMFPADPIPGEPGSLVLNLCAQDIASFESMELPYTLIDIERDESVIRVFNDDAGLPEGTWDSYPTYAGYVAMMHQYETSYPQLCQIHSIKTLNSGREILFARLGDNVSMNEAEPVFMYTSSIHGDETTGYILMLRLIDYLLTNYGIDPRITAIMDSTEIWINPLANPDGTYHGGNSSVAQATRRNANNVDINRNFPDPEDGPHPDGNPWQPETIAFMGMADSIPFTMSANFHGGAEVVNYPWDTWSQLHADDSWWVLVSNEYADTCQANSPSGYMNDFGTGITNGYAWYTISGGRQDYMNYFRHCREATLEISSTKLLPTSQLEAFWEYNYRSCLNYLEQSIYGVHGLVRDSVTKAPLHAFISITGHDADSTQIWSDHTNGDYHRLLFSGQFDISFSAPGYYTKTIPGVVVQNYQQTRLNVELLPLGFGFSESPDERISLYPMPAKDILNIDIPGSCKRWELFDIDGRLIMSGDGGMQQHLAIPVSGLSQGTYMLRLEGKKTSTTHRIVLAY